MVLKKYRTMVIPILRKKLDLTGRINRNLEVLKTKPVIYVYYSKTHLYIGQTIGFIKRHNDHSSEKEFMSHRFDGVVILFGEYVDLNALSDLEGQLISYLQADNEKTYHPNRRIVMNGKRGNRVVDYSKRDEVLSEVLIPFWENELKELGLVYEINLNKLRERLLFKYSPFTFLSEEQREVINDILEENSNYLIQGCAGTGKTVVLSNLVARLCEKYEKGYTIGVVVKRNWIRSIKNIFRSYAIKDNVIIGTPYQIIKNNFVKKFDIVIVDESHRLRWKYPKQMHTTTDIFKNKPLYQNELYLLGKKAKRMVLLYDDLQMIKPADISREDFKKYTDKHNFKKTELSVQFRIQIHDPDATYTADDYVNGIKSFLQLEEKPYDKRVFGNKSLDAYFGEVNSLEELFQYTNTCKQYEPSTQNRVLAGCSRPWISKNKRPRKEYDWEEGENRWYWNKTYENWLNIKESENEIGCIHAIQGIDLDYAGVFIGKDLAFRDGKVVGIKENYYDKYGIPVEKNYDPEELTYYIKRIYYVLLTRGINGIRIYIEDEALRKHFMQCTTP